MYSRFWGLFADGRRRRGSAAGRVPGASKGVRVAGAGLEAASWEPIPRVTAIATTPSKRPSRRIARATWMLHFLVSRPSTGG